MHDNKDFLGTESIGRLLFKLSVPTVIAQLINMLYNVVDRIYIGHIPGCLYATYHVSVRLCRIGQFRWST